MKRLFSLPFFVLLATTTCSHAQGSKAEQAVLLNNQALKLALQGQDVAALELYNRAVALDDRQRSILTNRASALNRLGRFQEAVSDADRVVELDEFNSAGYNLRASILKGLKLWERSRADFDRAIALDPDQPRYVYNRGDMLQEAEQWSAALGDFHRAQALWQAVGAGSQSASTAALKNLQFAYTLRGLPAYGDSRFAEISDRTRAFAARFKPGAGEIRFEARCAGYNSKTGQLSFDALAFSLPNGRFRSLLAPKRKTAILGTLKVENNIYGEIDPKILRADDFLVIVGRDNGQTLAPRAVFLALRSGAETKKRGLMRPELANFQIDDGTVPPLDWNAVGRPTFTSGGKTYVAGTAFVAHSPAGKRLVSAWHLITDENSKAPDGGGAAFLDALKEVRVAPFNLPAAPAVIATTSLTKDGASFTSTDASRDILVLAALEASQALNFAKTAPQSGNLVWIAGQQVGQIEARLISARVVLSDERQMLLLKPEGFSFQAMSGAPLLNQAGEVVGMLLGGGETSLIAVPLSALRARVLNPNR